MNSGKINLLIIEDITNIPTVMNYLNQVRAFVVSNFLFGDASSLQDDTSFLDSGIIDSTGILELIMFLEQEFNTIVEPEEMIPENLDSVDKLARFLARKLDSAAAVAQTPAQGGTQPS